MLHVILDCPPLGQGNFTSLDHEILDPKTKSMKALMDKGFTSENCFVFDSFPRRVKLGRKKVPREIWPEFKVCHDALHQEYRQHGGQITLVMGDNAEKAWKEILVSERVDAFKLKHSEGLVVWGEISRMVNFLRYDRSDDLGFRTTDQSVGYKGPSSSQFYELEEGNTESESGGEDG